MTKGRARKPQPTWWFVYLYAWLGLMTVWMCWLLAHSDGWRQLVTGLVIVADVVSLGLVRRDHRRQLARSARTS